MREIWEKAYKNNIMTGMESTSGCGSSFDQTKEVARQLPILFKTYGITTILDIPCGDIHWMYGVNLRDVYYLGADIVKDQIQSNIEKYEHNGMHFFCLDITKDDLPKVDLVLCRDLLVHFSFEDVFAAFRNIVRSGSTYFLSTTFTDKYNMRIATGDWGPINLRLPPYSLPKPLELINEGCTQGDGLYKDKSLALWTISDLKGAIER
jgi:hypothetical protein